MSNPIVSYANAAALLALFPTIMGAAILVKPDIIADLYPGAKMPSNPADNQLVKTTTRMFAVRDIFLGGATLGPWYLGDDRMMGVMMLMGAAVVFVDGQIAHVQSGHGRLLHWALVPVMGGLSAGLLGWLDGLL